MADVNAEHVYQVVRSLLPEMPEDMRQQAQAMLERAASGEKVDNRLIELLREDPQMRDRLREALLPPEQAMGDYGGLGGEVEAPAGKYACPVEGCDQVRYMRVAGQPIPTCEKHGRQMERVGPDADA